MKLSIKRLWLKALRSGKYKRAVGKLKSRTGHCCLGVLCDLYMQTPEGKKQNAKWNNDNCFVSDFGNERYFLPSKVLDWAGLDNSNPEWELKAKDEDGNLKTQCASTVNDKRGGSHENTAKLLKKYIKAY